MKKRRILLKGIIAILVAILTCSGWASVDHCGEWKAGAPRIEAVSHAFGPLLVGTARNTFQLPIPVRRGGFPFPQPKIFVPNTTLQSRALTMTVSGQTVGLVVLDVLLIPKDLQEAISKDLEFPVLVVATHTHSGPGGFDARISSEVAALGPFDSAVFDGLVKSARDALKGAFAHRVLATMKISQREVPEFAYARSGDSVETAMTQIQLRDDSKALAELTIVSAHPTFAPRQSAILSGDYPFEFDSDSSVLRVVVQGSAGNASGNSDSAKGQADMIRSAFSVPGNDVVVPQEIPMGYAAVSINLDRPDSSRLVPGLLQPALRNALCHHAEHSLQVSVLNVGPLSLLFVPVEPSFEAGKILMQASNATRIVSLTNGYEGYLEPELAVQKKQGESAKQYFGPQLLEQIAAATKLASDLAKVHQANPSP